MSNVVRFPRSGASKTDVTKPTQRGTDVLGGILNDFAVGEETSLGKLVSVILEDLGNDFTLEHRLAKLLPRNQERIERYRSLVASYNDDELNSFIRNADGPKIQERPHFYYALLDESKRRSARK